MVATGIISNRKSPLAFRAAIVSISVVAMLPCAGRAQADVGSRVYNRLIHSTVWVIASAPVKGIMTGTGTVIDVQRRLILTNYHVTSDNPNVSVVFPQYQKNGSKPQLVTERKRYKDLFSAGGSFPAKVLALDKHRDLALIQAARLPGNVQAVPLAREPVSPGQLVFSIGNPGQSGGMWLFTTGTVRQVYHKEWKAKAIDSILDLNADVVETQSPTNPGDSGGPLVDDRCELVGITEGTVDPHSGAQLLSTFIDFREVQAFLRSKKIRLSALTPPAVAAAPTPAAESPPTEATTNHPEPPGRQAERDAARKLRLARSLAEAGLAEKARTRYQEIVDEFPDTKAAKQAEQYLKDLNK